MHFGEEAAENVLVYEDFSGGNLERPQFKKMMKDSQKIAFAAIVVYRLDRISRNIGDFAECAEFDGEHGIMVYNRSLQRPGKANQIRPMEEWIVAVGKHPGIIAGSDWVRVQPCWMSTNPRATADPAATRRCCPGFCAATNAATICARS